jgi:branched-chain amino acid transport system permease protein
MERTGVRLLIGVIVGLGLLSFPYLLSRFYLLLATEMLIFALFATSFNLLFGHTGLLSFGHAAYFGVGAYATGLLLKKAEASLFPSLLAGALFAAMAALVIGYFCVRLDEIYFAMLTLAFAQILHSIAWQWNEMTGGSDGLDMVPRPNPGFFGSRLDLDSFPGYYWFTLVVVAAALLILWRVVSSPFGLTLRAIRENAVRGEFVGVQVMRYRLAAFVISGTFAGLAGALFAPFQRAVMPEALYWTTSAEPVLMTLLGGARVYLGPAVGAAVFIFIKDIISAYTEFWMLALGTVLILFVLFLPGGIVGFAWQLLRGRAARSEERRAPRDVLTERRSLR